MRALVTGSGGLIGSEAVLYFDARGWTIVGIDSNMRREFFGVMGDTKWNHDVVRRRAKRFSAIEIDIRDRCRLESLFKENRFDLVIHCAAQPSHDKAREIPLVDFDVNAVGTMNLLEMTRLYCREAVFIYMSTNKVYGDAPNERPLVECPTRWEYERADDWNGIDEHCRMDQSLHSLFGASKAAGDLVAQEYGRYFGMNVGIFRAGCVTGPRHSAVELHGFLSYLMKVALAERTYTVFGYQGKQVRDQIHSFDVVGAMNAFAEAPRPGAVYNIGGERRNSASILECFQLIDEITGKKVKWVYQEEPRIGDHICYISNMGKFRSHFPEWSPVYSLYQICEEIAKGVVDPTE